MKDAIASKETRPKLGSRRYDCGEIAATKIAPRARSACVFLGVRSIYRVRESCSGRAASAGFRGAQWGRRNALHSGPDELPTRQDRGECVQEQRWKIRFPGKAKITRPLAAGERAKIGGRVPYRTAAGRPLQCSSPRPGSRRSSREKTHPRTVSETPRVKAQRKITAGSSTERADAPPQGAHAL
ncbi:hypothetical protein MRX96_033703 [Rhipicephalus microplus]